MRNAAEYLRVKLEEGSCRIGQIVVSAGFSLNHEEDADREDLVRSNDPHEAIAIARYDDAGKYRPLKTAPNLRHGWRLELRSLSDAVLALDFLYPAALGTAAAQEDGRLDAVDLRRTLDRQTGMYAVVKKMTDAQADEVVGSVCRGQPGCLRRILWPISGERPLASGLADGNGPTAGIPLLCAEACNLLVAAGRTVVKKAAA
ncbi:MAG: DR2241 family protein [Terrimicrobiaceae bacterium]